MVGQLSLNDQRISGKVLPDGHTQQQHDDDERQCRHDRDVLQTLESLGRVGTSSQEHHRCHSTGSHTPEEDEALAGLFAAVGRQRAHDDRRGVGTRDEEDRDEDDRDDHQDDGNGVGQRQSDEEIEQDRIHVDVRFPVDDLRQGLDGAFAALSTFLDADGAATEDREPDCRDNRRNDENAEDELTHGATAGDAGDEEADEG